jgi:hypothetical protein
MNTASMKIDVTAATAAKKRLESMTAAEKIRQIELVFKTGIPGPALLLVIAGIVFPETAFGTEFFASALNTLGGEETP